MSYYIYIGLLVVITLLGCFTWWGTAKRPNRYGRYMKDNQKNTVPERIGWLMFEAPQWFSFALFFWLTAAQTNLNAATFVLFGLWQCHYFYRALIYPLRMKSEGKRLPKETIYFGVFFNSANGFVNAYAIGHAEHLMSADWLNDPRFMIGLAVAVFGWIINFHSDSVLVNLRKPGETGYKIPHGGMFRFISAANYFGEIVLWCGWAIMSWTPAGLVFAFFTIANLAPRAISHHRWYKNTFPEYPINRKALIPWVV